MTGGAMMMLRALAGGWVIVVGVWVAPDPAWAQNEPGGRMTFALTGDAIISRRLAPYREPAFLQLFELIRGADVAFTNLEILFRNEGDGYPATHSGGTWMTAEPAIARELVWAGFDIVSRANNHTMDFGAGGLRATTRVLDEVGLVHAGAGENLAHARAPAYVETRGGRVALISVASTFSDEDRAGPQRSDMRGRPGLSPLRFETWYEVSREALDDLRRAATEAGLNPGGEGNTMRLLGTRFVVGADRGRHTRVHAGDLEEITAVVRDASRQADWVIVTSHTHEGDESRDVPAEFLVEFTHAVIDAGADVFVGHGPHVLRAIEVYRGRPIFYSLGNFIFQNETIRFLPGDMYERYDVPGGLPGELQDARIAASSGGGFPGDQLFWESVVAEVSFLEGQLERVRLHPVTLGFGDPRARRGRPMPADGRAGRRIVNTLAELSAPFNVRVRYDANENVGIVMPGRNATNRR